MSTATLARVEQSGQIAHIVPAVEPFFILDKYAPEGREEAKPRFETLATISAGRKGENGFPVKSSDGTFFLHDNMDRAPGLRQAMAEGGNKVITIAFPSNNINQIIHQHWAEYTKTSLLCFGDHTGIRVFDEKGPFWVPAGTKEYQELLERPGLKPQYSMYFMLARYTPNGLPRFYYPDGFGYYRLRFTSRNSIRSIYTNINQVREFTNGLFAGIPFDLRLDQRDVSDGKGKRNKVPVWTLAFCPPRTLEIDAEKFAELARQALEQGAALMLPAPAREGEEEARAHGAELDMDDAIEGEFADIKKGGLCDQEHWRKYYFATVKDTPLDTEESRALLVAQFTHGDTESLSAMLAKCNEEQANAFINFTIDAVAFALDDARLVYSKLLDTAEALGIPRRELPAEVKFKTIENWSKSIQAAIDRRKPAAEAKPEAAVPVTVEPAQAEPAVEAEVVDTATTPESDPEPTGIVSGPIPEGEVVIPTQHEQMEAMRVAGVGSPTLTQEVKAAAAAAATATTVDPDDPFNAPPLPDHIVVIMDVAHQEGFAHGMLTTYPPLLAALNKWSDGLKTPLRTITDMTEITEKETPAIVSALKAKKIHA
jgi:hypothetical protein